MPTYGLYLSTLVLEFIGIYVRKLSNEFFKAKYFTQDKKYNDVIELLCKDSAVDGEYYIYMAKNLGIILFMRKDTDDGSLEESYSILDTQTIME